jgi:hypothetical protein
MLFVFCLYLGLARALVTKKSNQVDNLSFLALWAASKTREGLNNPKGS